MKYIKMLGLVAVAAAAVMATVGASSASATVLCKTPGTGSPTGTTCPSGWAEGAGAEVDASNTTTLKMDTTFKTIECTGSTIKGVSNNEGGASETVTTPEGTLTITGCNCTVVVLKAGSLEIHWISGTHNGTLTSNGAEITATCSTIFGSVHCIYQTTNDSLGDLTGGEDPILHSTAVINKKPTSGLCSEESTLTATYTSGSGAQYVTGHT